MAVSQRIEALQKRRAALKIELQEEESHPWHNEERALMIKRRNLRMKDEIMRLGLQSGLGAASAGG